MLLLLCNIYPACKQKKNVKRTVRLLVILSARENLLEAYIATHIANILFCKMTTLEAIKYRNKQLEILDQLLLPESCTYIQICNVEDAWSAIRLMKVLHFKKWSI